VIGLRRGRKESGELRVLRAAALGAAILAAASAGLAEPMLTKVVDVPLPGRATRFDYQSFDPTTKTLYFTHMGDGELVVFDTARREVVARLPGFPTATGVLVVPELHRVFVSVAGRHEVAVVDTRSLKVLARVAAGEFPDGLAYAPDAHRVFVSDESRGMETVIDTDTNRRVATIDMGGEVGNTEYDPVSRHILANVQDRNELVVIDPQTATIVGRHALEGGKGPHGLLILRPADLAVVACEDDARLLVVDLKSFQVKQVLTTGEHPDVLSFDPGLERLYVATESHIVSVFQLGNGALSKLEDLEVAARAHTISVNPQNHEVYLPLQNVEGRPVLRVMRAANSAIGPPSSAE
jgi:DNA-binding beta-propeller fold protein YncE